VAAPDSDTFINPDWANTAWYAGVTLGQSRATIDEPRIRSSLAANGATVTGFSVDGRDLAYSVLIGRQLNRYFAIEASYFDLGKFNFNASTSGGGVFNGQAGLKGGGVDLVGQYPLTERFSGNRLNAVTDPNPSRSRAGAKFGLGLEYKLSEALAVRAEVSRFRVDDAVGNRGDVDLMSLGLTYKFGRPAARAAVAPVEMLPVQAAAAPAPVVVAAVTPPPPQPVSEKVSFAAEALFDFDRAVVKPDGRAALDAFVDKLKGMSTEVMIAVGHTDSVGSDAYNQRLSLRRADAVKAYLVSRGLDAARLYTEGKGESMQVASNASAEGRSRNRRVIIEVVGTRNAQP
jgi:OOP family OmpA-OmpF porin